MVTGVVGAIGANARIAVTLALKHETGSATTHRLQVGAKIVHPVIQVTQNLKYVIIKDAQSTANGANGQQAIVQKPVELASD